jgi:hypothetical protein
MDNKDANEEFLQLDDGIQEALKSTFDNPDYLNKPSNWTILGTIGSLAKKTIQSPFTGAFKALQGYSQALTGTVGGTLTYAKQTGQYTPSMLNFWSDDWDGKRIWNVEYTKKLEETYGPGMSALAKGLVTGWTPGRVIEEAIANAVRHGKAHHIDIRISATRENLEIEVCDDGTSGATSDSGALATTRGVGVALISACTDGNWSLRREGNSTKLLARIPSGTREL